MYPLAVLLCRINDLDLPTSLVITGMRGAKAGVSPPRRRPFVSGIYKYASYICCLFLPVILVFLVCGIAVAPPRFFSSHNVLHGVNVPMYDNTKPWFYGLSLFHSPIAHSIIPRAQTRSRSIAGNQQRSYRSTRAGQLRSSWG